MKATHCPAGSICKDNKCVKTCSKAEDCEDRECCIKGNSESYCGSCPQCSPEKRSCSEASDCGGTESCICGRTGSCCAPEPTSEACCGNESPIFYFNFFEE